MTTPVAVRTALYRLHDAEGVLLYVGITTDPDRRFAEHAAGKHWWPQVARKSVEWYPDRFAAEIAEEAAIKAKNPRHNVVHSGRRTMLVTLEVPDEAARGLDLMIRYITSRLDERLPPEWAARFDRKWLIEWILVRELTARGLYGGTPCVHDPLLGWPGGVTVRDETCGCGRKITADGGGLPFPGETDNADGTVTTAPVRPPGLRSL